MDSISVIPAHVATTVSQLQRSQQQTQQQHLQLLPVDQQQLVCLSSVDLAQLQADEHVPKEVALIAMVSQEPSLYNPKNEFYRNSSRKDTKWSEIARAVGWSEMQCKAKWKALRDQYCRELKRPRTKSKATVKWKHFKQLSFLRPYALSRNYRPRRRTLSSQGTDNAFDNNKVESNQFTECDFTTTIITSSVKQHNTTRILRSISDDQLSDIIPRQDGNWNYLLPTSAADHAAIMATTQQTTDTASGNDVLYTLVDCVAGGGAQQGLGIPEHEEEDDDNIHTFLNIESYFERELIAFIQEEETLYNSYHPYYRNCKLKLEVWEEIARKLKRTVKQCRQKWKALRDQFIREHKRLKDLENPETLPRWKHYDALSFLQRYIKQKPVDHDDKGSQHETGVLKIEPDDVDMQTQILNDSPMPSPVGSSGVASSQDLQTQQQHTQTVLPNFVPLTPVHLQQQQTQQIDQESTTICVVNNGYGEMDITGYMIGDSEGIDANTDEVNQKTFVNFTNASNDGDTTEDVAEFTDIEKVDSNVSSLAMDQTQQAGQHDHQILTVNISESPLTTSDALQQQQQFESQLQQQQSSSALLQAVANTSSNTNGGQTATVHTNDTATMTVSSVMQSANTSANQNAINTIVGEDEVGAFFKAVAMKIRSAQLSPAVFTNLQINILRVINGTLTFD